MIVAPPKRHRSADDSILPLINVVFLLLIFFMLAGALTQRTPFPLTLPATAESEDRSVPEERVLSVAADGRLAFAGQAIERAALTEALADWPKGEPLQIRADSGLRAAELSALLATLRQSGIAEVRLLTRHQSQ